MSEISRPARLLFGVVAILSAAFAGYLVHGVENWLASRGRPNVQHDVTNESFRAFGLPFDRPHTASSVVVAALGNGFGDVVTFAGFNLPPADADKLVEDLRRAGTIWPSQLSRRPPYVDRVSKALSAKLWPAASQAGLAVFEFQRGHLAYDSANGRFYMYSPLGGPP